MIPNKTEVLNLKTRKTQVPMGYLSLIFKRRKTNKLIEEMNVIFFPTKSPVLYRFLMNLNTND